MAKPKKPVKPGSPKKPASATKKPPKAGPGKPPPKPSPWTPFTPAITPPPGSYDPSLDSQLAAGNRGLVDLGVDTDKANERTTTDWLTAQGRLEGARSRGLADLLRERTWTGQDFARRRDDLQRNYTQLGRRQAEQQRAAGTEGGAYAASRAKREENQGRDTAQIDQAQNRFNEDITTRKQRFTQGIDEQLGDLSSGYRRTGEDRGLGLARAQREQGFFGLDVDQAKWYQAKQTGYTPPSPPTGKDREYGKPGQMFKMVRLPSGQLVNYMQTGAVVDRKTGRPLTPSQLAAAQKKAPAPKKKAKR